MHSRCIPCRLHVGMGTARWAPRAPGRIASKQTQHTSSCSICRRGGVAGGVSSSRVGVNDIPPERADVLMDCWLRRRDAIYSDKSARQRTSRLCDCVFFFFGGGGGVEGVEGLWMECCLRRRGAIYSDESATRRTSEGFNFWRLVVGLGTTVWDYSTRRRVRCQVWLLPCFSLGLVNGWIVDGGGGTLCKATSPLRDARPNDAIFEGLLDWWLRRRDAI